MVQIRRAAQPPARAADEDDAADEATRARRARAVSLAAAAAVSRATPKTTEGRRRADSVAARLQSEPRWADAEPVLEGSRRSLSDPLGACGAAEGGAADADGDARGGDAYVTRSRHRASSVDDDSIAADGHARKIHDGGGVDGMQPHAQPHGAAGAARGALAPIELAAQGVSASGVLRSNSGALRDKLVRSDSAHPAQLHAALHDATPLSPAERDEARTRHQSRTRSVTDASRGETAGGGGGKSYACRLLETEPPGGQLGAGELIISAGEVRFHWHDHAAAGGGGGGGAGVTDGDGGGVLASCSRACSALGSESTPTLAAFAALSVGALSSTLGLPGCGADRSHAGSDGGSRASGFRSPRGGGSGGCGGSNGGGGGSGGPTSALSSSDLVIALSAIVRIEQVRALLVHRGVRILQRERAHTFGGFASAALLQQATDVLRTLSSLAALRPAPAPAMLRAELLSVEGASSADSVERALGSSPARLRRSGNEPFVDMAGAAVAAAAAAGARASGGAGAKDRDLGSPDGGAATADGRFELGAWLHALGLAQYASALREAGLGELELVSTLTRAQLRTCGVVHEAHVAEIIRAADLLPRVPADAARTHSALAECERVREWLLSYELQQYTSNLLGAGFDSMGVVEMMTVEDMAACGIDAPGHRRRLMKAVEEAVAARREREARAAGLQLHADDRAGRVAPVRALEGAGRADRTPAGASGGGGGGSGSYGSTASQLRWWGGATTR